MIFDRNNQGAQELKELIGFIHKSINFQNLRSYIEFAQREVTSVVGEGVFNQALDHYHSEQYLVHGNDPQSPYYLLDLLVQRLQLAVALNAYRRYAPGADLSHSDKGRQIFVSEQEKPAFEWQIEKDNENLLSLASEATESLLEFLDQYIHYPTAQNPLLAWSSSEQFLGSRSLLISSARQFEKVAPIGSSRLTFLALVPFLQRIQDNEIRACFQPARFAELLSQLVSTQLSEQNKLILEMAVQPLGLLALSMAIKRMAVRVKEDGVFSLATEKVIRVKTTSFKADRNEVAVNLEKDGLRELAKLQKYLASVDKPSSESTEVTSDRAENIDETLKFVRL
jgi:hypothetical protein